MILQQIVAHKREEVALRRVAVSQAVLEERARSQPPPLDLASVLRQPGVGLIAEVKRASPSRGPLRPDLDPRRLAQTYTHHGAVAISVLTDARFFEGSMEDLVAVKRMLVEGNHSLPVLCKDFILEPYQVYEARACGADALLLIAAALEANAGDEPRLLADFLDLTHELRMSAVVEVHSGEELEQVLPLGPRIVGINNRDLGTFRVDLGTTLRLRPRIPAEVAVVSESGIRGPADVRRLAQTGVDAVLVGEALVTADDVGSMVQGLVSAGAERGGAKP